MSRLLLLLALLACGAQRRFTPRWTGTNFIAVTHFSQSQVQVMAELGLNPENMQTRDRTLTRHHQVTMRGLQRLSSEVFSFSACVHTLINV